MTKKEIIEYLQMELADLKQKLDDIKAEYAKADHMGRVGMASSLDKAEDKYYHFLMVCNDLGAIEHDAPNEPKEGMTIIIKYPEGTQLAHPEDREFLSQFNLAVLNVGEFIWGGSDTQSANYRVIEAGCGTIVFEYDAE